MKKTTIIRLLFLFISLPSFSQNVGINSTGAAPDASALLDLNSNNKGFLITRVDTANITSPAFGLMTLAPSDSCLYMYNGVRWMGMGGGGTSCRCNCSVPTPPPVVGVFPPGTIVCVGSDTIFNDVTSTTGKIWMDRNLGATQVATSSTDAAAYGDLYQWGRFSDGHQCRNSATTAATSNGDIPGHNLFITTNSSPFDWRVPQNNSLWQGATGINNPCPSGYRIPTRPEYAAEEVTFSGLYGGDNSIGAYNSPLKFTVAGERSNATGTLQNVGVIGEYWSNEVNATNARALVFTAAIASPNQSSNRAFGFSVRCIKN